VELISLYATQHTDRETSITQGIDTLYSMISTHNPPTQKKNLQQFKKLISSAQTYTYISQKILQNMQHKQTYHLFDEVHTPYFQEKHCTLIHK